MGWTYSLGQLAEAIGAGNPGADVSFCAVSTDTRTLREGEVFFALSGENFDGNGFVPAAFEKGAAAAVCSTPQEGGRCLVVGDPLAALQQFASWHRDHYNPPLLAITGSCGKTTAKDLTSALLATRHAVVKTQGNLNNEIGCPLSLLGIDAGTEAVIIEMGANHMGEVARLCAFAKPTEAAITMIAPAHLEGFGSVENVAKAKGEIVEGLGGKGVFYVNTDDPRCVGLAERFPGEKVRFGSGGDVALTGWKTDSSGDSILTVDPVGELRLPLPCRAHATNVLLAVAVGLRHGVTEFEAPLREALSNAARFKVLRVGPLEVLDDTYNANPASMAAGLETLKERGAAGRRFAALGDMLELGDEAPRLHRELGECAARCGVDHLYVRGDFARDVVEAAHARGVEDARVVQEHEAMAAEIAAASGPGDVVLVKGSRGMRMEGVIEALRNGFNQG